MTKSSTIGRLTQLIERFPRMFRRNSCSKAINTGVKTMSFYLQTQMVSNLQSTLSKVSTSPRARKMEFVKKHWLRTILILAPFQRKNSKKPRQDGLRVKSNLKWVEETAMFPRLQNFPPITTLCLALSTKTKCSFLQNQAKTPCLSKKLVKRENLWNFQIQALLTATAKRNRVAKTSLRWNQAWLKKFQS